MTRITWKIVTAVLLSAGLAGCGSSAVDSHEQPGKDAGAAAQTAPDGMNLPNTPVATPSAPAAGAASAAPSASAAPGTAHAATGAGHLASGTTGTTGHVGTASAPGVSATAPAVTIPKPVGVPAKAGAPVTLGIVYGKPQALASAVGASRPVPDTLLPLKEIVGGINAKGGIDGRKVQAVYYGADLSQDMSVLGQAACAAFTQDAHVNLVINSGIGGDTLPACLQRAGVSMINTGQSATDATDMARFPNVLTPDAMATDRSAAALLKVAALRGVLKKGDKLGVLTEDCPWANRVLSNVVQPLADSLGVSVVRGTHKCITNLLADLGPVSQSLIQETFRFQSAGVTHVMAISAAEGFDVSLISKAAAKSGFAPKYLVTSNGFPYNLAQPGAAIAFAPNAMPNVFGVGYLPLLDVGNRAIAEDTAQAGAQQTCRTYDPTLAGSEQDTNWLRYQERNSYYAVCDAFQVAKAVLSANGVRYTPADIMSGYTTALAQGLPSAALAGGYFRSKGDRLDGAGYVRPFAWDAAAKAFTYSGSALKFQ